MKIGILIDELEIINFDTDSTIEFAKEGLCRDNEVWLFFPSSLILLNNRVYACAICYRDGLDNIKGKAIWKSERIRIDLHEFDVILIRHDPPYNSRYLTSCYLLERLKGEVLMINDPTSLRDCPEKLFVTKFPEIHPPTLITADWAEIMEFRTTHREIVIKPLYQFRGIDIFYVKENDRNFYSILESLERIYREPLVVQKYIPEVRNGDKRVFLLNGMPVAALNRLPKDDDSRSNMFVGGKPEAASLTIQDQRICNIIGPELSKLGLLFAGIDIIGEFVTEINVTAPTGVVQVRQLCGINLASEFWDLIEKKI